MQGGTFPPKERSYLEADLWLEETAVLVYKKLQADGVTKTKTGADVDEKLREHTNRRAALGEALKRQKEGTT